MILAIASEANKLIAVDDFTNHPRKTGFARVKVEINASNPLKPGVVIKGENF